MLALAVLHLIAVALIEHRLEYRPLLYITAGMILGLIINPYFPENIIFSYRHMLPKLADATLVRVGNEWFPYETKQLLDNSLPALAAFASGALALGLSARKMDVRTAFAFLTSLLFGLMLFQARRFVEYFPPFSLIFAAFAWTPLFPPLTYIIPSRHFPRGLSSRFDLRAYLPVILLSLVVAISIARSIPPAREALGNSKPYDLYAGASAWLKENTEAGARVFQTDWDDFPRLFFYNTHNTYLVGLDPTYMQLYNPDLYDLWVEITQGDVEEPSELIAGVFASQYVHTDLNHEDFLLMAQEDPGLEEVYRDDQAVIFEVTALD